jgi:hypothetical protein
MQGAPPLLRHRAPQRGRSGFRVAGGGRIGWRAAQARRRSSESRIGTEFSRARTHHGVPTAILARVCSQCAHDGAASGAVPGCQRPPARPLSGPPPQGPIRREDRARAPDRGRREGAAFCRASSPASRSAGRPGPPAPDAAPSLPHGALRARARGRRARAIARARVPQCRRGERAPAFGFRCGEAGRRQAASSQAAMTAGGRAPPGGLLRLRARRTGCARARWDGLTAVGHFGDRGMLDGPSGNNPEVHQRYCFHVPP